MQVDPSIPKLKLPGTTRFKLTCDMLLSTSAFKFNLRCYMGEWEEAEWAERENEIAKLQEERLEVLKRAIARREVGSGKCRPPRHRHAFESSFLELCHIV